MPKITIETDLYDQVEQIAIAQNKRINDLLNEAVRHYLWELDQRKISAESKIYRQHHAELKRQYLGQYIAMHNGEVVDHDADFQALYQRVRQRYGRTPVLMTRVEATPERILVRRGFRMERPEP